MGTFYHAIYPADPTKERLDYQKLKRVLRDKGVIDITENTWKDSQSGEVYAWFNPGEKYKDFIKCDSIEHENVSFHAHDSIQVEVYTFGEIDLYNPETGTELDWATEISNYTNDSGYRWKDPKNNKLYGLYELESKNKNFGFGYDFIFLERGEPKENLMALLEAASGQKFKWMAVIR